MRVQAVLWLLVLVAHPAEGQTIALISDLNGRYGSTTYDDRVGEAIGRIIRDGADVVLCAGDMVAGQKQPKLDAMWLDSMWSGFNEVVFDPLREARIPLLVTAGNHDASGFPAFGLERERFVAQWKPRQPELEFLPGSEWPRRYAVMLDDILLLTFDGTMPGKLPASELDFLDRMLSLHSSEARATVVFSHLPMWPFTRGREDDILDDPSLLASLHRHGVDVFVSGHHHGFYAGTDPAGLLHVSIGALGGNVRPLIGEHGKRRHGYAMLKLDDAMIQVYSLVAPGFTRLTPETLLPETLTGPLGMLTRLDGPTALR